MSQSYDFVIIGGGTAGLVVATRLSEVSHFRVLVLEAGTDHSEDLRVKAPALYTTLLGTEADWSFQTEPQVRRSRSPESAAVPFVQFVVVKANFAEGGTARKMCQRQPGQGSRGLQCHQCTRVCPSSQGPH